jgi:hypothetical protein
MLWFFKIFSPKNLAKKLAFLSQNKAKICKNFYHNIGFWEKRQFFHRKLAKIAENCDRNIDPMLYRFTWKTKKFQQKQSLHMYVQQRRDLFHRWETTFFQNFPDLSETFPPRSGFMRGFLLSYFEMARSPFQDPVTSLAWEFSLCSAYMIWGTALSFY